MRKLLLLLLIAVVGAGIAFGANAAFFSTASSDRPLVEPRGLVSTIPASDVDDAEPTASASPKPTPESREGTTRTAISTTPAPISASVRAPDEDAPGPRQPRRPAGYHGSPEPTAMVVQGVWDQQDAPDDPCDLEESERDRRRCENEADREEDDAEDD